jgi:hypothetical protein
MTDDFVPEYRSASLAHLAAAKARAQAKFLPLGKDKTATVTSQRTGGSYSYSYADLAACLESVIPALSEEGIALFQPVRIEAEFAIATTLLVHGESGEWISSDYTAPVMDARDARSVGSAATYARRYGLLSMLAIASSDEDDDAEAARGGAHEMPSQGSRACPVCAVVGSIIKGKAEYGGGWLCWKNKGGCGTKWPEGPYPTEAPPVDPEEFMPRRTAAPAAQAAPSQERKGKGRTPASPTSVPTPTAPEASSAEGGICGKAWKTLRCHLPSGHESEHVFSKPEAVPTAGQADTPHEADRDTEHREGHAPSDGASHPIPMSPVVPNEPPKSGDELGRGAPTQTEAVEDSPQTFTIGPTRYVTKGITREQMLLGFRIITAVDKIKGAGWSKALRLKMFAVTDRNDLTRAQAEQYFEALYQAVPSLRPKEA